MADEETKKCKLRNGFRFNGSLRTIFICNARHGFSIAAWRCVGRHHAKCPLVIAAEQSVNPTLVGGRVLRDEETQKLINPAGI